MKILLNADGMVNVHPKVNTQIVDDGYIADVNIMRYLNKNNLYINSNGDILDREDDYKYGRLYKKDNK